MNDIPGFSNTYSSRTRLSLVYVDDNHLLLDIIKHFLERENLMHVQTFLSPKNAISFLKDNNMDLILSDYDMPGMNGAEFLYNIRSQGINTPFILYTSNTHDEVDANVFKQNSVHYLSKFGPIEQHIVQLKDIIRKCEQNAIKDF